MPTDAEMKAIINQSIEEYIRESGNARILPPDGGDLIALSSSFPPDTWPKGAGIVLLSDGGDCWCKLAEKIYDDLMKLLGN